jgi:hypothetical protein
VQPGCSGRGAVDTANADRDAHVLSPDIIDVARRPTMVFRSTRIRGAGSEHQVDGDLTIGDVTRPIVLAVELGGIEAFPGGPRHAGFEGTTEVRRKDLGIDVALPPGVSVVDAWCVGNRGVVVDPCGNAGAVVDQGELLGERSGELLGETLGVGRPGFLGQARRGSELSCGSPRRWSRVTTRRWRRRRRTRGSRAR